MGLHIVAHDIGRIGGQDLCDVGPILVRRSGGNEGRNRIPHDGAEISFLRILRIELGGIDINRKVHIGLHECRQAAHDDGSQENAKETDGKRNGDNAVGLQSAIGAVPPANAPLRLVGGEVAGANPLI